MDALHAHLLFNHAAIFGYYFSILLYIVAMIMRSELLKRTALIGLVGASFMTVIVFASGEGAGDRVKDIPGILRSAIDAHEEAAEVSIWLVSVAGFFSLGALSISLKRGTHPVFVQVIVITMAVAACISFYYVGRLGGQIRHTELLNGSMPAASPASAEEHDDD